MKKPNLLIASAWAVHLVAWFVPVIRDGVTLPDGVPGWDAFRVAASTIWPAQGIQTDNWYGTVLCGTSAVSTVLFILASPWIVLLTSRALWRVSAWIAAAAFIVNSHWCLIGFTDLRAGYLLWWASFCGGLRSVCWRQVSLFSRERKSQAIVKWKSARVPGPETSS